MRHALLILYIINSHTNALFLTFHYTIYFYQPLFITTII